MEYNFLPSTKMEKRWRMEILVLTDLADLAVLQMIITSGLSTSGKLLTNHLLLLQALKGNTGWVWSG